MLNSMKAFHKCSIPQNILSDLKQSRTQAILPSWVSPERFQGKDCLLSVLSKGEIATGLPELARFWGKDHQQRPGAP